MYVDLAAIPDHVVACTRAGLQAGFHSIGDGAMEAVVAGCEEAAAIVGLDAVRAGRHRIEHAEMLDDDLIARMAQPRPLRLRAAGLRRTLGWRRGMYVERLGLDRALTLNPFADLSRAGVPLALGSDTPVTPLGGVGGRPGGGVPPHLGAGAHRCGGVRRAHDRRLAGRGVQDAGRLARGAPAHLAVWDTARSSITAGRI